MGGTPKKKESAGKKKLKTMAIDDFNEIDEIEKLFDNNTPSKSSSLSSECKYIYLQHYF